MIRSETYMTGGVSIAQRLKDLNRQRRVRRMRRVVIASATAAQQVLAQHGRRGYIAFATLTYRPGVKWQGNHINEYMRACKAHALRRSFRFRYQWVIELTKQGAPHYHVLFWLPYGEKMPKPDTSGSWPHGRSNIKQARNPVGYIVKYATKGETSVCPLPKGARLFGVGGGTEFERLAAHRAGLPMWLVALIPHFSRARKVARVGWIALDSGEIFSSPFVVTWYKDDWGVVVVKVVELEVLYGLKSADRRCGGEQAHDQFERGWDSPSDVADRDFAMWQVRLSAEFEADARAGTLCAG